MTCYEYNFTGGLFIDYRAREWCKLPYPGHPNGCPNYGKKDDCPPKCKKIEEVFNLELPHWLSIVEFNLGEWANRMKEKHPKWTDKQCRCCLYWQGSVRKELRQSCDFFTGLYWGTIYTLCPEAMGLNVIKTLKRRGFKIRAKPKDIVYKVALIGYPSDYQEYVLLDYKVNGLF